MVKKFQIRFILVFVLLGGAIAFLVGKASTPQLPSARSPLVFYANQSRQDLKLLFCEAIRSAKKSLHVCFYGITDRDIIAALGKKAQDGIALEITYDPTASLPLRSLFPSSAALKAHNKRGLMHRKILSIDNAYLLLGSANLTPSSLRYHSNLILGLYSPDLAGFIEKRSSSQYQLIIEDQKIECYLLPDAQKQALERLLALIAGAQKSIRIAMFTFTHPQIAQALIAAHQRGVSVSVILDSYSGRGASRKTFEALKAAGIRTALSQGQQLLHHKWAIVDEEQWIMGSANWTKAAFAKNEDFLLILSTLTKEQIQFLNRLWSTLEIEAA
ncbi:MAG TPA: phospholipase D-like domain-containing protein [Rhabdochlamydiaceae bacterium]